MTTLVVHISDTRWTWGDMFDISLSLLSMGSWCGHWVYIFLTRRGIKWRPKNAIGGLCWLCRFIEPISLWSFLLSSQQCTATFCPLIYLRYEMCSMFAHLERKLCPLDKRRIVARSHGSFVECATLASRKYARWWPSTTLSCTCLSESVNCVKIVGRKNQAW